MKLPEPAFIRLNTPELREKLEKLGKRKNENILNNYPYEYENEKMFLMINSVEYFPCRPYYCSGIDCGDHIELFLALAALREDTDLNQWFISPGGCLHKCAYGNWCDDKTLSSVWRKATPAELISHFTEKGGGE